MKRFLGYSAVVLVAMSLVMLTANFDQASGKTFPALAAPAGSADQGHNAEGIKHYNKGHWDIAEEHFREAVKADKNLAEAHYNLALCLDKLGRHKKSAKHFGHALKLAPDNPAIADSQILKDHLGM